MLYSFQRSYDLISLNIGPPTFAPTKKPSFEPTKKPSFKPQASKPHRKDNDVLPALRLVNEV